MTALAAEWVRPTRNRQNVRTEKYPMATGVTIYKGSYVTINSSGYAIPASVATAQAKGGIATQTVTNSGANGAVDIEVEYNFEALFACDASVTIADTRQPVYVIDDATVGDYTAADTAGEPNLVGQMIRLSNTNLGEPSGHCWVFVAV